MKILASADVHGRWPVYEWLLEVARARHVETIVLAGDLLGCPDGFDTPEEAQRYESQRLTHLLTSVGLPVLYIMGNDDLVELDSQSELVAPIHARRIRLGRFFFVGYQYSLPFMGGTFEKSELEIKIDLEAVKPLMNSNTVFVSHSPALGILDPGFGEMQIGSRSLHEFLESNPFLVHVHGHSHGGFGRRGQHLNVAAGGRKRAMILDLETMEHDVVETGPGELEA